VTGTLLTAPHHDGSELYVPEPPKELGATVVVRLRIPRRTHVDEVAVRYVYDGEPRFAPAVVDEETPTDRWWRATFRAFNPRMRYRWLLTGGDLGYAWLNGVGLHRFDMPDADDFVLAVGAGGPEWHLESVVYEVFPDRFATSGLATETPEWASRRDWGTLPNGNGAASGRELYGGDLAGIEAHLDHVTKLGATALYLTPIFPAGSAHRYDASSFARIDPLLGGDDALRSLVAAAQTRGLRIIGDLTLNHVGSGHDWFRAASADPNAPERELFFFDEAAPNGYVAWAGVPSLPKLNHGSPELGRRLYGDRDSVVRHWLDGAGGLDGWRVDCANVTGRQAGADLTAEVARRVRSAVEETRPDGVLVAEHNYDARGDLRGDGWQGVMNYPGFLRPVWCWLRGDTIPARVAGFFGIPAELPRLRGGEAVASMRAFRAGVPWPAVLHSWVLLDSHDTARFSVVTGSRDRQLVGVGLQMTTPGVPMVFAGDEIGLGGEWGEDARRPMPWQAPETWDETLHERYRSLIALRRSNDALARGGMRYVHVSDDAIAYLRETRDDRVLCLARRAEGAPITVEASALGAEGLETLVGADAETRDDAVVLPGAGPAFHAWRIE
jgi:alpha-glucosidase